MEQSPIEKLPEVPKKPLLPESEGDTTEVKPAEVAPETAPEIKAAAGGEVKVPEPGDIKYNENPSAPEPPAAEVIQPATETPADETDEEEPAKVTKPSDIVGWFKGLFGGNKEEKSEDEL